MKHYTHSPDFSNHDADLDYFRKAPIASTGHLSLHMGTPNAWFGLLPLAPHSSHGVDHPLEEARPSRFSRYGNTTGRKDARPLSLAASSGAKAVRL
jgi:hypothetical protein